MTDSLENRHSLVILSDASRFIGMFYTEEESQFIGDEGYQGGVDANDPTPYPLPDAGRD